jgi:PAS domain S-box-containing protein
MVNTHPVRPHDPFQNSRLRKAPYFAVALGIAIYHIGSLWFGDLLLARAPRIMPAFRGFGIDVPVFVVFGPQYWPVLLGTFFASSVSRNIAWLPSGALAGVCVLRTLAGASVFRRVSRMKKQLAPFEDMAAIVAAGIVGPVVSAGLGTLCLVAAGKTPPSLWAMVAVQWWVSDSLGMLVTTPVLIGAARWWSDAPNKLEIGRAGWTVLYLACVAATCYFIFSHAAASYLLFSVFLLILFAAAWFGPTSARAAALVIAFTAMWATHNGVGAFAGQTLLGNLQNLALFLTAVSVTGMAVGPFRTVNGLALPGTVLVVGWALSGWLYASMDRDRARYDSARLDEVIGSVENRINNRFQTYEKVLWGGAGYLAASGKISPKDWHTYVAHLHLLESDPGTTAMAIVQPVPASELDNFVRGHRTGEWPAFTVHGILPFSDTPASLSEHLLVVCAEPAAVAARSIGADLALDPMRRAAAEEARDSGAAVLTKRTTLGDRSGQALQLFVPVYREDAPVTTVAERRRALMAWVTVVFRADTVFRSALGELEPGLALRVYHRGEPAPSAQFFASDPKIRRGSERFTHLNLGQNTWTLGWTRLATFPYISKAPSAWAAGCTALLSLLLAWLVVTLQATKRRATDRLKLIESASSLGTWELDTASQTLHCSQELLRLYGIEEDHDCLPLEQWLSYVHLEDREALRTAILSQHAVREPVDRQYRVVWRDGTVHWLHSRALPVAGEPGRHPRVVGVDFDISEVKQLQSQLAQAQKLESVGQLAAGVAHEINTPIQYVGDNAKFLEDAFRELIRASGANEASSGSLPANRANAGDLEYFRKEVPVAITEMQEGLSQVARIVRAMKEFSHPGPIDMAAVDINQAIESTVLVSKHEWKFIAELTTDLDPALPLVPCVAGELNQAVLNLIINAAHAIGDAVKDSGRKGKIHISTRRLELAVEIRVADTGTGIPEDIQARVFDPFFTTKPVGKGTGQGLAIAHTVIVQKHKGKLRFETEPGRGTTFVIELPLVQELEPA